MRTEQFFRCLADHTRIRIVLLIWHEQEISLSRLAFKLNESEKNVARHMALLLKNTLVLERREELSRFYRINTEMPRWTLKIIKQTYIGNKAIIDSNLTTNKE